MNLEKTRNMALKLMRKHGLTNYTFKWDRAVRRFGCHDGRMQTISLSRPLTLHETNRCRVKNTILHEIAHALDYEQRGYSNHDRVWKRTARSIGCSGERCSSSAGVDKSKILKWVATCPSCERKVYYARQKAKDIACGKCCNNYNHGSFSNIYKFIWKLNSKIVKSY